jgi:hypothetical protein
VDQVCFALPVLEDKTEDARAFFEELETQRKSDYAASEQRINISKESWHLQHSPQGDLLLAYLESPDFANEKVPTSPMRLACSRSLRTPSTDGSKGGSPR